MVSDFYNNFGTRSRIIFGDKIKLKKRTKKKHLPNLLQKCQIQILQLWVLPRQVQTLAHNHWIKKGF